MMDQGSPRPHPTPTAQLTTTHGLLQDFSSFRNELDRCPEDMINDTMIGKTDAGSGPDERRDSERIEVQAEAIVAWHFQPDQKVRYRTIDYSETGMRIISSTPLLEGMTGVVVSMLPEGRKIDRACMVVWSRHAAGGTGHEAGLRFF